VTSCRSPRAYFAKPASSYEVGEKVFIENMSDNASQFIWSIDDESFHGKKDLHFNHTFEKSGIYKLHLQSIEKGKKANYYENIEVKASNACRILMKTNLGNMVLELSDLTPLHRDNFIKLTENGYYDNILFHRVIEGFMAQTGDPNSRIQDAKVPSLILTDYLIPKEFKDTLVHVKGTLAAARIGEAFNPDKASSATQFYLVQGRKIGDLQLDEYEFQKGIKYTPYARHTYKMYGGTPQLDMEYTVFGKIISGLDVLDNICSQSVDNQDKPIEDIKILKMIVLK
jgi:peptidyl-prolyl cis-trans isomerase B (cyclophilin B)